ncbi:phage-related protein [Janthinobacterium sp. Marseille]|nr:DUF551 domain-containing protein [Janthinobacterium sp. Marseille]ABR91764.1 phage-related protein [Janthinobacterium sp. Marseille]
MSEWISIKERFPAEKEKVLIFFVESNRWPDFAVAYYVNICGKKSWSVNAVGGHEWDNYFHDDEITHWMPLPAPPEQK